MFEARLDKIIGEIILEKKKITPESLAALRAGPKGKSLSSLLIEKGLIREEELYASLSEKLKIPYVPNLREEKVDFALVSRLPITFAKKNKIIPLQIDNGTLRAATANPLNYEALDDLRLILECSTLEPILSSEREIIRAINFFYEQSADSPEEMIQSLDLESSNQLLHELEETADILEVDEEAPVIKLVNLILSQAVKERASDIHIEPFQKELKVRYRIDGVLYHRFDPPKRYQGAIVSRLKVMAKLDIAEKRLPQDGRIPIKIGDKDIDIRVSIIPTNFGERVVLRLLDKSNLLLGLEDIGLAPDQLATVENLIRLPQGMILVTGPTGSGKTTTLYAALSRINSPDKNIITIEDPVEYQLFGIGQIQVNPKIGLTFAQGLRSVLRHDPDVILVGEIRDTETAEIAIQAALTGHLVFSTLHTNNAASAVTRLVDMGIEPFLVASVVRAIIAQRLIRVICPNCKEGYVPEGEVLAQMGLNPDQLPEGLVYYGQGCAACAGTGFRGRTGIYEILNVSEPIRQLIMRKADSGSIAKQAIKEGMRPLREDGLRKVIAGITTIGEVVRVTQE